MLLRATTNVIISTTIIIPIKVTSIIMTIRRIPIVIIRLIAKVRNT